MTDDRRDIPAPKRRTALPRLLFLAAVFALPFMRPPLHYPLIFADLLFCIAGVALAAALLLGRRHFRWRRAYWLLVVYVVGLGLSIAVSPDRQASAVKMTGVLYLIALAVLADQLIETADDLRATILTWIAASAIVGLAGLAALAALPLAPGAWLVEAARNEPGTLPAGAGVRLRVTFYFAAMMCNYMTVSLGLVLVARARGWIGRGPFFLLLAIIGTAGLMSLSPGIGGIVLLLGIWFWLRNRTGSPALARIALGGGMAAAAVAAMSLTLIPHDTAPFVLRLPGDVTLWPTVRLLTWTAATREWLAHPLLGHGLGVDAVSILYRDPLGALRSMRDAHNVFLNIAAQSGVIGLAGLAALIGLAWRLTFHRPPETQFAPVQLGLGLGFLVAFVYQGLGGSFEDARHLWLLLGMLLAAQRLYRPEAPPPAAPPA